MPTTHVLKCERRFFDAIVVGEKPFTVRRDDRFFQTGDIVELVRGTREKTQYEFVADPNYLFHIRRISYVLRGFPGVDDKYCVLGFEPLPVEVSASEGFRSPWADWAEVNARKTRDALRETISDAEAGKCVDACAGQGIVKTISILSMGGSLGQNLWDDICASAEPTTINPTIKWDNLKPIEQTQLNGVATRLFLAGFSASIASAQ